MFVDFALVLMLFFLAIPTMTGYFAYSYGLSFWKWFIIGCFLPLFANILLIYRVKNYEKIRKEGLKLTRYEDEYMNKLIGESFLESDSLSKNRKGY
jgi:4-hydroxybenzoate polyprenyltransferase